jgi:ketosteroid isomerase-like protein
MLHFLIRNEEFAKMNRFKIAILMFAGAASCAVLALPTQARELRLTERTAAEFVERYRVAWQNRSGKELAALWHPDGILISPAYDRPLKGSEIETLTNGQFTRNPDLSWNLIGWTWRGETVILEWENRLSAAGKPIIWRGVDKMTLKNGRIWQETVYADTEVIRAAFAGRPFKAMVVVPPAP